MFPIGNFLTLDLGEAVSQGCDEVFPIGNIRIEGMLWHSIRPIIHNIMNLFCL